MWGPACGGADCQNTSWSPTDEAFAWPTSYDEDMVVWGTHDEDDMVVWGTSGYDEDMVVWGTSGPEDVVWDCNEPPCSGGN